MRGEHIITTKTQVWNEGSSPHARGTPQSFPHSFGAEGIIPACAGNTDAGVEVSDEGWDHPRMRGEHSG